MAPIEVLKHADNPRRLCRQDVEGWSPQIKILLVKPKILLSKPNGIPSIIQLRTHPTATLARLTRPAADDEIATVNPTEIIKLWPMEAILESLMLLRCEGQLGFLTDLLPSYVTNKIGCCFLLLPNGTIRFIVSIAVVFTRFHTIC